MSSFTLEHVAKIKARFAALANTPARANIAAQHIIQYNVSLDGKVAFTFVVNLKDFVVTEEASTVNDLEINITDEDVQQVWASKVTLVELLAAVSLLRSLKYL